MDLSSQVVTQVARIVALELSGSSHSAHLSDLQDSENRSRQNNIRLLGILEATQGPHLLSTVMVIFNLLLGQAPH